MDTDDGGKGSEYMFKTPSGVDPFYSTGWDQLVSMNQSGNFGGNSSVGTHNEFVSSHVLENPAMNASSHMIQSFGGSGSFSEMVVGSFGLPECGGQMTAERASKAASKTGAHSDNNCQNAEELAATAANSSPSGKRKRRAIEYHSPLNPNKNVEGDQHKGASRESSECSKDQDENKVKMEQSSKHGGKQTNNSNSGEQPKDNYIHVRAKRGQATNSHSLAERVRRERISERMRLLQELVPGCNKITGKAMMLDEIINYVQSLQQQVEFLSMKLATVNPEVNIDIERILSKDILHSRHSTASSLPIPPGLNVSNPFPGIPLGIFPGIPNITAPFNPLPQNVWDNDLHNLLQMGYDSNPSINNLGPNGR